MPLSPKPNCTIDTNCIIGLDEERDYAQGIRELIAMHEAGQIVLRVVGVSASEKQPNGLMAPNFSLFKERLKRLGLGNAVILMPPAYLDITYLDNCYFATQNGTILEAEIHNVLWPNLPFQFHQFEVGADKSKENWKWKWLNPKCDTLAYMAHVQAGSGLFVTNDRVFHGEKKAVLLKFAGGDIAKPLDAKARLEDPAPFAATPQAVSEFLRVPTERVDPATIPLEFERLHANKRPYDERMKLQTSQN